MVVWVLFFFFLWILVVHPQWVEAIPLDELLEICNISIANVHLNKFNFVGIIISKRLLYLYIFCHYPKPLLICLNKCFYRRHTIFNTYSHLNGCESTCVTWSRSNGTLYYFRIFNELPRKVTIWIDEEDKGEKNGFRAAITVWATWKILVSFVHELNPLNLSHITCIVSWAQSHKLRIW